MIALSPTVDGATAQRLNLETRAARRWAPNQKGHRDETRACPCTYETIELDLDDRQPAEVLVKTVATSMCHSDDHVATGAIPVPVFPICAVHEGAGVVQEVGSTGRGIYPGDHVVFAFLPFCGRCGVCLRGQQNLCDDGANLLIGSRIDDAASRRMHLDGVPEKVK